MSKWGDEILEELEEHPDITEMFLANTDAEYKKELPKITTMSDVECSKAEWLIYPYIPLGKLTIVQGDPGGGKTMTVLKIASMLSKGEAFFTEDRFTKRDPCNVIYQTAEDGYSDTIKPRLATMGADFSKIYTIDETQEQLSFSDSRIEYFMKEVRPKLMVFDPYQAYLGADIDMHRANETRPVLARLITLAEKYSCAIICIVHMSKASGNKALYRSLGSIDLAAVSRSILLVGNDPENKDRKIMCHVKSSLAKHGDSFAFYIDPLNGGIVYDGIVDYTADDISNPLTKTRRKPSVSLDEAKEFITEYMQKNMKDNHVLGKGIMEAGENAGISKRTIYNARDELGIEGHSIGFGKNRKSWWSYKIDPDFTLMDSS